MRISTLLARNLAWYWRTNLAVLAGVATATGVLGGALLVGESVRDSLRDLVSARLGNAEYVVARDGLLGEDLSGAIGDACPVFSMEGVVTQESNGRRAGKVEVYGVDERFWKFQGLPGGPPSGRQVLLTAALEQELDAKPGESILLRVNTPSAIPREALHGRKEDPGKTIRLSMNGVAAREFSLRPQQGDVRAVYVSLARLQRELAQPAKVNVILARGNGDIARAVKDHLSLAGLGIKLRTLDERGCLSLESDSALIGDSLEAAANSAARSLGLRTEPVLTYLANGIRSGKREVPYSLVTALDSEPAPSRDDGITLNEWAARELDARPGEVLSLDFFVWRSDGQLHTETAQFRVERIIPISGLAADRDLAPEYPGITESKSLHNWDPPFPLDLKRVRPIDEQYWDRYRTTPKAFIRLARGRSLWGTRFGSLTSIRVFPPSKDFASALRSAIDPSKMAISIVPVKEQGLAASRGATDFGEYFTYFSFFLMVSALLLTGLFFQLGTEQRVREIGTLRALGFSLARIRRMFLLEGAMLATAGALVGISVSVAYGALILFGLRTWWFDAVGTRLLSLRASAPSLLFGAAAGVLVGLGSIAWTLRRLKPMTPRGLMAGWQQVRGTRRRLTGAVVAGLLAIALVGAGITKHVDQTAAFFGAGTLAMVAALLFESVWLNSRRLASIHGQVTLGLRSAAYRPGRSILCIALIASAVFVIVSLDAFRRDANTDGTSGFQFVAEAVVPLIYDPNTPAGREALNIPSLPGVEFVPFRLRPGDDVSCLNLYRPNHPRILAPPAAFLRDARFSFQSAAAGAPNQWMLLESAQPGGAIPAIADANSMEYVLHAKLGEEIVLGGVRFRIVAALKDSLFQGELLISNENFLRLFPENQGYRFFLLKAPMPSSNDVTAALESSLSDYGFDMQPAESRLRGFHRVENSYLSIFRALGALGLILGTVGLGAILLRNVLERRRELALLRAVGYRPVHLAVMVLAESVLLLVAGLATGTICALVAIAPAVLQRGGHLPLVSLSALLGAVLLTGISASLIATWVALRSPLLAALRSE